MLYLFSPGAPPCDFLLTRLYDWLNTPKDALVTPKDPYEYLQKLRFHRGARGHEAYGLDGVRADCSPTATSSRCSPTAPVWAIPGPEVGGAVLRWRGHEKELSGGARMTTNNRMEMTAAIEALASLKRPSEVRLHTDSMYLRDGITRWIGNWKRNGWRTADKKAVKNADLWRRLEEELAAHRVGGAGYVVTPATLKMNGRTPSPAPPRGPRRRRFSRAALPLPAFLKRTDDPRATGRPRRNWQVWTCVPLIASSGEIASQARFYSGSFFVVMFAGWAGRMKS